MVAFGVFVPFEEGKIDHPKRLEDLRVAQLQRAAHVQAQFVELAANLVQIAREHQDQIPCLGTGMGRPPRLFFCIEKLVYTRLERAVFVDLAVHEAAGPDLRALDPVGQAVELLAGVFRCTRHHDAQNGFSAVEDIEPDALRDASVWMQGFGQFEPVNLDAFERFLERELDTDT